MVGTISPRRRIIIMGITVAFLIVTLAGLAGAAFSVSGEGSAAGAVVDVKPLTVVEGKVAETGEVLPGGTGDVKMTIRNPNVFAVEVVVSQNGDITTDQPSCDPEWFTFTAPTDPFAIGGGESLQVELADALALSLDADNGCSDAAVSIPVAVTGTQIVAPAQCVDDGYEPNDLPPGSSLGAVDRSSPLGPIEAFRCPMNDDYYEVTALDSDSGACIPGIDSEDFTLTIEVTVADVIDGQIGFMVGRAGSFTPTLDEVVLSSDARATLETSWTGSCGVDDSRDFWLRVTGNPGGEAASAAGSYTMHFSVQEVD